MILPSRLTDIIAQYNTITIRLAKLTVAAEEQRQSALLANTYHLDRAENYSLVNIRTMELRALSAIEAIDKAITRGEEELREVTKFLNRNL